MENDEKGEPVPNVGEISSVPVPQAATTRMLAKKAAAVRDDPECESTMRALRARFVEHPERHLNIKWLDVEKALQVRPDILVILNMLEVTGGEPDVFMEDGENFIFGDCSAESPLGRRNMVFSEDGENYLLRVDPDDDTFDGCATRKVNDWGADFMTEAEYRHLQTLGNFDVLTRSWLRTPEWIEGSGNAVNGHRDGDKINVWLTQRHYHGANFGFRCSLKVPKIR